VWLLASWVLSFSLSASNGWIQTLKLRIMNYCSTNCNTASGQTGLAIFAQRQQWWNFNPQTLDN
jgi:hypothetical protein